MNRLKRTVHMMKFVPAIFWSFPLLWAVFNHQANAASIDLLFQPKFDEVSTILETSGGHSIAKANHQDYETLVSSYSLAEMQSCRCAVPYCSTSYTKKVSVETQVYSTESNSYDASYAIDFVRWLADRVRYKDNRIRSTFWIKDNAGTMAVLYVGKQISNAEIYGNLITLAEFLYERGSTQTFYAASIQKGNPDISFGVIITSEYTSWDELDQVVETWSSGKDWAPTNQDAKLLATLDSAICVYEDAKLTHKTVGCNVVYYEPLYEFYPAECGGRDNVMHGYGNRIDKATESLKKHIDNYSSVKDSFYFKNNNQDQAPVFDNMALSQAIAEVRKPSDRAGEAYSVQEHVSMFNSHSIAEMHRLDDPNRKKGSRYSVQDMENCSCPVPYCSAFFATKIPVTTTAYTAKSGYKQPFYVMNFLRWLADMIRYEDSVHRTTFWVKDNSGTMAVLYIGKSICNGDMYGNLAALAEAVEANGVTQTFYATSIQQGNPEESFGVIVTSEYSSWDELEHIVQLWSSGKDWVPQEGSDILATLDNTAICSYDPAFMQKKGTCDVNWVDPRYEILTADCPRSEIMKLFEEQQGHDEYGL